MSDAIEAAVELSRVFDEIAVRHLLGGSLASSTWGEPRFTQDVDFVAELRADHVDGLVERLGPDRWYADEVSIREAIQRRSSFNVIRLPAMVKIDVFVPPDEGLHESKWTRARLAPLGAADGPRLPITSAEDIVLQKLDWFRRGEEASDRQWRDVTSLLRIRAGRLDERYLDAWAERMDLTELLDRARRDARK